MILLRILRRDLSRSRGTMSLVAAFVALSALLVAGGTGLIVTLNGALDALFAAARVPDVVQMHAGPVDRDAVERWAATQPLVAEVQLTPMIVVDAEAVYLAPDGTSEEGSVMDIGVVRQNASFDFLLDERNAVFAPQPGEIGVPMYYARRDGIAIGDRVRFRAGDHAATFTVAAIVRDAQMNPAIVHSKRFVVHPNDFAALQRLFPETEFLISLRLHDPDRADEAIAAYRAAGMPAVGPIVDRQLFRTLNGLSEGIVAAVVILLSGLLMVIALLCLRFSILASIEEEYREIGVMKAIGMPGRSIRLIYVAKYVAVALAASAVGYAFSRPLSALLAADVTEYLGSAPAGSVGGVLPMAAAAAVCAAVVVSAFLVLRRFRSISAVGALRGTGMRRRDDVRRVRPLHRSRRLGVNTVLGLRDVAQRPALYALLGFIFFFAVVFIVLPLHFLSTMTDPGFVSYMGIGTSDIRMDLRHSESMDHRFAELNAALAGDPEVARYAALVTSGFDLLRENGERESIAIETGDIGVFPLDYLAGAVPTAGNEIALSFLNARDLDVAVGDTVTIAVDGTPRRLTVSGIYQDVTNGGRTAKARLPYSAGAVRWYAFAVDVIPGVSVAEKTREYAQRFAPARVTDLAGYMTQTLGSTIDQLGTVTLVALIVGLGVSMLVTALFLHMLVRKDADRIAVMRRIGASRGSIRRQYRSAVLTVLALGLVLGTLFANTLGERLVSVLWSFMGAARIHFVVDALRAYLLLPLAFAAAVILITRIVTSGIGNPTGEIR